MHVDPSEADKLVSQGWVIWPRSKAAKAGLMTASSALLDESIQPAKRAYIRKAK